MTRERPYSLSVAPELEAFRRELEYACDALDACHLTSRTGSASTVLHYGPNPPAGAVSVPAALFPGAVRVNGDGLHPRHDELAAIALGGGPSPLFPELDRPTGGERNLHYDALGLIVCMLSRLEERGHPAADRYGRFAFDAHMAVRAKRYGEPLADRAAKDLTAAIRGEPDPASRTSYRVVVTHDVDSLRGYHRPLQPLRYALGDVVKRARPAAAWARLRSAYFAGEPWRSVRWLMRLSEQRNLQSRFYFLGPSTLDMDSPYALTMRGLLRRVVDEICGRGHVAGFHPGAATASDAGEWQRQRAGLEEAIGRPVREGRQHVLGYRAEVTPDIWNDAGMETDFTLGFPEASGFRNGSCRPHRAYSLKRRRPLDLIQIATPIMDFGMFGGKYRDLTVDDALAECEHVAAVCRRYGGTLVVLYHSGQTRPPLATFYERLLACVQ